MSETPTSPWARGAWGLLGLVLVGLILILEAPELGGPLIAGISVASAIVVAIVGPIALEFIVELLW